MPNPRNDDGIFSIPGEALLEDADLNGALHNIYMANQSSSFWARDLRTEIIDAIRAELGGGEYRLSTAINHRGYPDGFETWEEFENYLVDLNTENIRNGVDSAPIQRYLREVAIAIRYLNPALTPEEMEMESKSLLTILRYIKKKFEHNQIPAPGSRYYKRVYTIWSNIHSNEGSQHYDISLYDFEKIINKFLKLPNGVQLIRMPGKYTFGPSTGYKPYFRSMIVSLNTNEFKIMRNWETEARWQMMLENGDIILYEGEYYSGGSFFGLRYKATKSKSYSVLNIPCHFVTKFGKKCVNCGNWWKQEELKIHPRLEMEICPLCDVQENPSFTKNLVSSYHGRRGHWSFLINRLGKETSIPMGIELEMHSKRGNSLDFAKDGAFKIHEAEQKLNKKWHEFYFEQDGSLANGGIEMVVNPMTLEFATEYWKQMLPLVRKEFIGWNIFKYGVGEANSYGIHVTVKRSYLSDYQWARIVKFLNNKSNMTFNQAIAQRTYTYGGNVFGDGSNHKLTHNVKIFKGKISTSISRYTPLNMKDSFCEFRIFASTLNEKSFMKNYEFIDALLMWVKETGYSESHEKFLEWLYSNRKVYARYPNLVDYLNKDTFYVRVKGVKATAWTNHFKKGSWYNPKLLLLPESPVEVGDTTIEDTECV